MTDIAWLDTELAYRVQQGEARLAIELALANATRPVISSRFGPESAVFLHLMTRHRPDIPVVHVQTGYETRATRQFVEELRERFSLNLQVFSPERERLEVPPALDDPAHAAFVAAVKLEPFDRALVTLGADVWLSSIRRYQSAHRQEQPVFRTLDSGRLKVSPLLGWSAATVSRYADEHHLPSGPEAFDPTKGEPWRECGLHVSVGG